MLIKTLSLISMTDPIDLANSCRDCVLSRRFDVLGSTVLLFFLVGGWKEQQFPRKHVCSLSILCLCSDPAQ